MKLDGETHTKNALNFYQYFRSISHLIELIWTGLWFF